MKKMMKEQHMKVFVAVTLLAVLIIGGAFLGVFKPRGYDKHTESVVPFEVKSSAVFACREGKTIEAKFGDSMVHLVLNDGRTMNLVQGISASGARYMNTNETFVFWNKDNVAFIQENAKITFVDCKTQS